MTFSATGIIIPVVAVLLNHIDKNHEGSMKPINILQPFTSNSLYNANNRNQPENVAINNARPLRCPRRPAKRMGLMVWQKPEGQ